jgi:hypothetical protein
MSRVCARNRAPGVLPGSGAPSPQSPDPALEGWVLVEKVGRAGEIVEQLDSRDEANQQRGEHGRA